ncbi:MAG: hypothetical protein AAF196_02885 [Planctomycetota bacterium]
MFNHLLLTAVALLALCANLFAEAPAPTPTGEAPAAIHLIFLEAADQDPGQGTGVCKCRPSHHSVPEFTGKEFCPCQRLSGLRPACVHILMDEEPCVSARDFQIKPLTGLVGECDCDDPNDQTSTSRCAYRVTFSITLNPCCTPSEPQINCFLELEHSLFPLADRCCNGSLDVPDDSWEGHEGQGTVKGAPGDEVEGAALFENACPFDGINLRRVFCDGSGSTAYPDNNEAHGANPTEPAGGLMGYIAFETICGCTSDWE